MSSAPECQIPLHARLRQYRVIAVAITGFFMWQLWELQQWIFAHHKEIQDWLNATLGALQLAYVGALKYALEHILDERNDRSA